MYYNGLGVAVDYEQARPWLEKAAAQDHPKAVGAIGSMYSDGNGVNPGFRRAREHYQRATELGDSEAVQRMQNFTKITALVTSSGKPSHTTPTLYA